MAVSVCTGLSVLNCQVQKEGVTPHSPGLTVWLSASLLTGIQPSALPERVPRGKAEALSLVPATWLWEPRPPLPFLPLLASEKLWFVQEALSSESDAGEAACRGQTGWVFAVVSVLCFGSI